MALADALGAGLCAVPRLWNRMGNGRAGPSAACCGYWVSPGRLQSASCPGAWSAARDPSGRDGDAQLPGRSIYYLESGGMVPALEFLDACPGAIDAKFTAVLDAVVAASLPPFSSDVKWEAMQG